MWWSIVSAAVGRRPAIRPAPAPERRIDSHREVTMLITSVDASGSVVPIPSRDSHGAVMAGFFHSRAAYFPMVFTRGRSDSGSLPKSAGLTSAGEMGAGPFSFSIVVPVGLNNS